MAVQHFVVGHKDGPAGQGDIVVPVVRHKAGLAGQGDIVVVQQPVVRHKAGPAGVEEHIPRRSRNMVVVVLRSSAVGTSLDCIED